MQKWEYLRLDVRYKDPKDPGVQSVFSNYEETLSNLTFQELHHHLNLLGSEGWNMVGERAAGDRQQVLYFKRRVGKKASKKLQKEKSAPSPVGQESIPTAA